MPSEVHSTSSPSKWTPSWTRPAARLACRISEPSTASRSLIANLEKTAELHAVGRLMVREELQRSLCTRLYMAKRWNDEP
jgi:hypothetical protein